jgi:sorting nexin-1/2
MASIGQSIAGPRFHETDEVRCGQACFYYFSLIDFSKKWFDRQKAYLDSLESQLRGLVKAIELVAKHRSGVFFS